MPITSDDFMTSIGNPDSLPAREGDVVDAICIKLDAYPQTPSADLQQALHALRRDCEILIRIHPKVPGGSAPHLKTGVDKLIQEIDALLFTAAEEPVSTFPTSPFPPPVTSPPETAAVPFEPTRQTEASSQLCPHCNSLHQPMQVSPGVFLCPHCSRQIFPTSTQGEKTTKEVCTHCGSTDIKSYQGNQRYCYSCHQLFTSEANRKRKKAGEPGLPCTICKKTNTIRRGGGNLRWCKDCERFFTLGKPPPKQIKKMEGPRVACTICKKTNTVRYGAKGRRWKCKDCERLFTPGMPPPRQIKKMEDPRAPCTICSQTNTVKAGAGGRWKCKDCKRFFIPGMAPPKKRKKRHPSVS